MKRFGEEIYSKCPGDKELVAVLVFKKPNNSDTGLDPFGDLFLLY